MGVYLFVRDHILTIYLAVDAKWVTSSGSKLDEYAAFLEKTSLENRSDGAATIVVVLLGFAARRLRKRFEKWEEE